MMGLYSDGAKLDDATRPYLRNKLDRLIDKLGCRRFTVISI